MRIGDFLAQVAALPGEQSDYAVYLAAPDSVDGDSIDVQLVPVVRVDWESDPKAVRLYPELPDSEETSLETLEDLMGVMPLESDVPQDARLQVEEPIVRTGTGYYHVGFVDVTETIVGPTSKEMWLLTKPRSEFAADDLPA